MRLTFPQRAFIIFVAIYCAVWLTYVVATSERAERRVHQAEEVMR